MGKQVCMGGQVKCTFGAAPSNLVVLPTNRALSSNMPNATIMDHIPMVNIIPFGTCSSLGNPQVIAATTAAFGVLTSMPCIPVTPSPWTPGNPTVFIANQPIINDTSICTCIWGGVISLSDAGQQTVND